MDIHFNCPHCSQDLTVDDSMAGVQLECPKCSGQLTIPSASTIPAPTAAPGAGAAREAKHFVVPQRDRKQPEVLLRNPVKSLELAAKQGAGNLHVKTFRRLECVEGGKDAFDEVVSKFLNQVGEGNVVRLESFEYSRRDPETRDWVIDHGLVLVYRG